MRSDITLVRVRVQALCIQTTQPGNNPWQSMHNSPRIPKERVTETRQRVVQIRLGERAPLAPSIRSMPHERAESRIRRPAPPITQRTHVDLRLVRGAVEVRLQRHAVAELLCALRALPELAHARVVRDLRAAQTRGLKIAVGVQVEERAVEEGAFGVGGDEGVVHALAVDAGHGARPCLPMRDEVAFVEEGLRTGDPGAVEVAGVVDCTVLVCVKVDFRDEEASAIRAVPVILCVVLVEIVFAVKFLPTATAEVMHVRLLVVVLESFHRVEKKVAFVAVMVIEAALVMRVQRIRGAVQNATVFAEVMDIGSLYVMIFDAFGSGVYHLARRAIQAAVALFQVASERFPHAEEFAAFPAIVMTRSFPPVLVQIPRCSENQPAIPTTPLGMFVEVVFPELAGV